MELRKTFFPCADLVLTRGRQHRFDRIVEVAADTAESMNLCMRSIFQTREPGDPTGPSGCFGNAEGGQRTSDEGKADVNADGRSDDFVVPT